MTSNPGEYRLSVIVPVYNERDTLPKMLAELIRQAPAPQMEVVIVDDGSSDGTRDWLVSLTGDRLDTALVLAASPAGEIAATAPSPGSPPPAASVRVHFHAVNRGKGAAVRTGLGLATFDVLVIQDADLEYDPADLTRMFALMKRGVADVVYGTRFAGHPHRSLYLHHRFANWLISGLVDVLCNATLADIEVCYKMFHRDVLRGLRLVSNDFGFEVEFTVKVLLAKRWRIYEVGISYFGRTYAEGKKINWKDGLKALWYVFRFRFFP